MRRFLAFLLLAGCAQEASPDAPWTAPAELGPYGVGATTLIWLDGRDKAMTAELWYPARVEPGAPGDDYGEISVAGYAHRDAEADLSFAPYPTIVFSHGFGGIRYQSTFLTEHLASHGFVVISPDHPRNTLLDLDQDAAARVAAERPGDIRSTVDRLFEVVDAGWFGLGGLVDPGAGYGMSGHSFGGWTTVGVSGGRFDPAFFADHCENEGGAACQFIEDLSILDDIEIPTADDRVLASAALAPAAWYAFGEDGLRDVVNPLVVGGTMDGDMPYESEIRAIWERLGEERALLTIERAGHWGFTDLCTSLNLDVFSDCAGEEDGFVEPSVTAAITKEVVTAHFQVHLRGDARAEASLGSARWGEAWEE